MTEIKTSVAQAVLDNPGYMRFDAQMARDLEPRAALSPEELARVVGLIRAEAAKVGTTRRIVVPSLSVAVIQHLRAKQFHVEVMSPTAWLIQWTMLPPPSFNLDTR